MTWPTACSATRSTSARWPLDGFPLLRNMGQRKPVDVLRDCAATDLGGGWGRLLQMLKEWPDLDLVVFQHGFDISPMPIDDFIVVGSVGPLVLAARECQMPKAVVLHSMGNDQAWKVV